MRLGLFLLAESLFNLGLFVFFLLYNLHLLDLGFDESFLGMAAALMTRLKAFLNLGPGG